LSIPPCRNPRLSHYCAGFLPKVSLFCDLPGVPFRCGTRQEAAFSRFFFAFFSPGFFCCLAGGEPLVTGGHFPCAGFVFPCGWLVDDLVFFSVFFSGRTAAVNRFKGLYPSSGVPPYFGVFPKGLSLVSNVSRALGAETLAAPPYFRPGFFEVLALTIAAGNCCAFAVVVFCLDGGRAGSGAADSSPRPGCCSPLSPPSFFLCVSFRSSKTGPCYGRLPLTTFTSLGSPLISSVVLSPADSRHRFFPFLVPFLLPWLLPSSRPFLMELVSLYGDDRPLLLFCVTVEFSAFCAHVAGFFPPFGGNGQPLCWGGPPRHGGVP